MKSLLIVMLTAFSITANAQLYVQPTATDASYIYVNDTYIYVDQDVNLTSNSTASIVTQRGVPNIVLRNGSQLLQGNGADQLNKGSGDVSIYQEGTTNQWDYNLWASPVGVAFNNDGTVRADGNGIFAFRDATTSAVTVTQQVFYVPAIGGAGVTVNSNPALIGSGLNGSSAPNLLSIASFWIYGYEAGNSTAEFIAVQDTGSLPAGLGFTMKGVSGSDATIPGIGIDATANNAGILGDGLGQRIDFKGRPNNGTITATVLTDTQTITGNPYPSALDLNYFLLLNSDSGTFNTTLPSGITVSFTGFDVIDGSAYFWDSDPAAQTHFVEEYQAGYGVYSTMGLLASDGMYVEAQYLMYDEAGNPITASGPVGGTFARRFSPVGQGFLVVGSPTQPAGPGNDTFTFTNDMRIFVKEGASSQFRSNVDDNEVVEAVGVGTYYEDINNFSSFSQFKIGVNINDTYGRDLGVGILDHATQGYDPAMDARSAGATTTDISFSINEEDQFVINAVPDDEYQALQLSITADTPSEFRFRARDIEEFNYEGIFLFDTLTEIYYDIQIESVLISLDAGEYPKRFEIRFTREVEENTEEEEEEEDNDDDDTTDEEEGDWEEEGEWEEEEEETLSVNEGILESFTVFQNNSAGQLEIKNPNGIALTNVTLFDITGKQIFLNQDLGTKDVYTFSTRNLSTGIYVVTFVTEGGFTKARKVSITNN